MHLLIVLMAAVVVSSTVDEHEGRRCGWNTAGLKKETESLPDSFHRAVQAGDSDVVVEWRKSAGPIKDQRVTL